MKIIDSSLYAPLGIDNWWVLKSSAGKKDPFLFFLPGRGKNKASIREKSGEKGPGKEVCEGMPGIPHQTDGSILSLQVSRTYEPIFFFIF